MKTWITVLAAATLSVSAGVAQEPAPLPSATVNFTTTPIKIDGRLDETAWNDAPVITLDMTFDGKPVKGGATVRFLWDKTYLYMGVQVPDQIVVAGKLPRDGFLWEKDDVVELFLWPREDQPYYYEIVANPRGTIYDAFFVAKPTHDGPELTLPDWSPDIRVQTRLAPVLYRPEKIGAPNVDGFWSLEMAVPIASLASRGVVPAAAGETWRAQINRYNRPDPGPGLLDATAWSPYYKLGEPYLLDRFGKLTLTGGPNPVIPPVVPESVIVGSPSVTAPGDASAPPIVPATPVAPVAPEAAPVTPATPDASPVAPAAPEAAPVTPAAPEAEPAAPETEPATPDAPVTELTPSAPGVTPPPPPNPVPGTPAPEAPAPNAPPTV